MRDDQSQVQGPEELLAGADVFLLGSLAPEAGLVHGTTVRRVLGDMGGAELRQPRQLRGALGLVGPYGGRLVGHADALHKMSTAVRGRRKDDA
ncbi:hypothetical protein [Streptomyces sp. NPDC059802]|uniref:hypothetical protein n=1 Tax=Streptomyces sp. NPDC059802 TaxID=3346952 RepID=UPI00365BF786